MYADKTLTCADCSEQFVFTERDQEFYAQRGFTEPRRCASCRAIRRLSVMEARAVATAPGRATATAVARTPVAATAAVPAVAAMAAVRATTADLVRCSTPSAR